MKVFTIGFTKTTAESFFNRLTQAGVRKVLDVRLNNVSQLAGFAKRDDLTFFLSSIGGIGYEHARELAPTKEMLDAYKKNGGEWDDYAKQFLELMLSRKIEEVVPRESLNGACLLCSEDTPHYCHRRLVVEYLQEKWGDLDIVHL
jgi:uncharacterized protein (DUF488 family)